MHTVELCCVSNVPRHISFNIVVGLAPCCARKPAVKFESCKGDGWCLVIYELVGPLMSGVCQSTWSTFYRTVVGFTRPRSRFSHFLLAHWQWGDACLRHAAAAQVVLPGWRLASCSAICKVLDDELAGGRERFWKVSLEISPLQFVSFIVYK